MQIKNSNSSFRSPLFFAATVGAGILCALLHVLLVQVYIKHPAHYDEMFHMLAAASWNEQKTFAILDGVYDRAWLFTILVGKFEGLCGETLECVRWASILPAAILVFATSVFTSQKSNLLIGTIAGLALAVTPALVNTSQMVRFYTLHSLVVFLIAVVVFELISQPPSKTRIFMGLFLIAIIAAIGMHLQELTVIALLAVSGASLLLLLPRIASTWKSLIISRKISIMMGMLGVVVLLYFFLDTDKLIAPFSTSPGWAEGTKDQILYYYQLLRKWFPVMWPLFLLLSVSALLYRPKVAVFFAASFLISFILLSFAASKSERYIVFAMPFFVIAASMGTVHGLRVVKFALADQMKKVSMPLMGHRKAQILSFVFVICVVFVYLRSDPLVIATGKSLLLSEYQEIYDIYGHYPDWEASKEDLRSLKKAYPFIISSAGTKAAYYVGDFDMELNASTVKETDTGLDFGLDGRTGRRVIFTPEALCFVIHAHSPGMAIIESDHLDNQNIMHRGVRDILNKFARQIEWRDKRLSVWVWEHNVGESRANAKCSP